MVSIHDVINKYVSTIKIFFVKKLWRLFFAQIKCTFLLMWGEKTSKQELFPKWIDGFPMCLSIIRLESETFGVEKLPAYPSLRSPNFRGWCGAAAIWKDLECKIHVASNRWKGEHEASFGCFLKSQYCHWLSKYLLFWLKFTFINWINPLGSLTKWP